MIGGEALMSLYTETRQPPAVTTGFRDLDHLTGGFRPGAIWAVTGTPGQGRTTLLVQWAALLAVDHGWPTWLTTPREHGVGVAARLLALTAKVPVRDLLTHSTSSLSRPRLADAERALSAVPLTLSLPPSASVAAMTPRRGCEGGVPSGEPFAVVVDDSDLTAWCTPEWAANLARQGALVVVSLPRECVAAQAGDDADLLLPWARVADVMVEVRSRGLAADEYEAGEALLTVLKHRHGPTTVARVTHQGHYARFVDSRD